ncbi:Stk1 family PASTA domain-containing Ser/Thr kinase [Corynebacterium renale]|uniref:non-specific serine/threonine protein kinase n=1 Tax=Corynebacterium renale TaxID=1724 RepID=A0A2A9DPV9_9CORY|nr:PASTA domain-containing protein [Corynebacterium renale]PFG28386.1 serine/threonine protein kinase [Corynebacterium renale]SQI18858.1 serine/threonine-protein kinase [Corynebacterium renale]
MNSQQPNTERAALKVGDVLDGRYRVDHPIARGGMSTVYRCVDLRLGRSVAVKVMDERFASDPMFVQRFQREARAMARLSHPNLVGVYDFSGVTGISDGQAHNAPVFLVMELITGGTLRELLRERGPMPPHAVVAAMRQVLTGLQAAHAQGLVHRDMKPDNVLIAANHTLKIADFGLVRSIDSRTGHSEQIVGTAAYISPEQVAGEHVGPPSDVYSTGIMAFELLTGEVPFVGDTPQQQAYARLHDDVPAPSDFIAGVPPLIDALIASATARNPEARFADAGEFLSALDDVARELELPDFTVPVPVNAAAHRAAAVPTDTSVLPRVMEATGIIEAPTVIDNAGKTAALPTLENDPDSDASHTRVETWDDGLFPPPGPDINPDTALLPHASFDAHPPAGGPMEPQAVPEASTPANPASQDGRTDNKRPVSNRSGLTLAIWWIVVLLLLGAIAVGGWWLGSGRYGEIPYVVGMDKVRAVAAVEDAGFHATTREIYSNDVPKNAIAGTDPAPDSKVVRGNDVAVLVSQGKPTVPEIQPGNNLTRYQDILESRSLTWEIGEATYSDDVPAGDVASTTPPAGVEVPVGSQVTLHPSKGPAPVEIPDVSGMSEEQARGVLERAGLRIGDVSEAFDDSTDAGKIISVSPAAGDDVPRGTKVHLIVSNAIKVPNVQGLSQEKAQQKLADAGLTIAETSRGERTADTADTVTAVSPKAGTLVDPAEPSVTVELAGRVSVPSLVGKKVGEAQRIASDAGLRLSVSDNGDSDSRIISQSPRRNKEATPNATIEVRTIG